jgi:hypothetical protein
VALDQHIEKIMIARPVEQIRRRSVVEAIDRME